MMVQSWAMGSHSATTTTVRRSAVSAGRFGTADRAGKGLRTARILFFAIAFVVLFCGLTLMRTFASEERIEPANGSEITISADTGDTLWGLATSVKKPSMDTRQAVHLLMKRNGLSTSDLESGQMLIVPADILP